MDAYLWPLVSSRFYTAIIISITDIERSPNYIVFGLQLTHKVRW